MNSEGNTNPFLYSYKQAADYVKEFEEILSRNKIKIKENSSLKRICENVKKLTYENFNFVETEDIRPFYREVIGLCDLIIKIIKVKDHPDFKALKKHLELLNETESIPQTTKNIITDQNSNKIFELLIGAISLRIGNDVVLDDPIESKGDNPDVLLNYGDKKWGLACKTINNDVIKAKSILDNIEIGVEQIQKSEAEIGIVIISLKNVLVYDELWPILNYEKYKNGEIPVYNALTIMVIE